MSIERSQSDAYVKEMAKWEQRDAFINGTYVRAIPFSEGGRKDAPFEAYPKMLYQAEAANGGPRISRTKTVHSEGEELIATGQGWCARQEAALADVHRRHTEDARLAAERAATERWMSEGAQAEARAVDEVTMQHVPVIPETPLPGKRTKVDVK